MEEDDDVLTEEQKKYISQWIEETNRHFVTQDAIRVARTAPRRKPTLSEWRLASCFVVVDERKRDSEKRSGFDKSILNDSGRLSLTDTPMEECLQITNLRPDVDISKLHGLLTAYSGVKSLRCEQDVHNPARIKAFAWLQDSSFLDWLADCLNEASLAENGNEQVFVQRTCRNR